MKHTRLNILVGGFASVWLLRRVWLCSVSAMEVYGHVVFTKCATELGRGHPQENFFNQDWLPIGHFCIHMR